MNQQILEMQDQGIEQMKAMQMQVAEFHERVADSVVGALPEVPAPFADYMPKSTEVVNNYFDFMGQVRDANREFVERVMAAWIPEAPAAATSATKAKK